LILRQENKTTIEEITKNKGQSPRVYRNTLFFLYPLESERPVYLQNLMRYIAYGKVESDRDLGISDEQRREISKEYRKAKDNIKESIQRLYRIVSIPGKEAFDLGIPTFGEERGLDVKIYDDLRAEGEILERTTPLFLKTKYLSKNPYVLTEQLYQSTLKTPGEPRYINKTVLESAISDGVTNGIFGLGVLENDKPRCQFFKKSPSVSLSDNEILISETICIAQGEYRPSIGVTASGVGSTESEYTGQTTTGTSGASGKTGTGTEGQTSLTDIQRLHLKFSIPMGKVSNILGVINFLTSRFKKVEIVIEANEGAISEQDYENKVKEAFDQIGVKLKEE